MFAFERERIRGETIRGILALKRILVGTCVHRVRFEFPMQHETRNMMRCFWCLHEQ